MSVHLMSRHLICEALQVEQWIQKWDNDIWGLYAFVCMAEICSCIFWVRVERRDCEQKEWDTEII